uniref:Uncharacterized protein n=1 Tax=Timema poppense TaxID=170557 RepID=A0A7R9DCP6_TIMPO|nr:unnamed protein product [Timema poppensis]
MKGLYFIVTVGVCTYTYTHGILPTISAGITRYLASPPSLTRLGGGHDSPCSTPRSPSDVDEGIHYAVPYSAVGTVRSVVIADAPYDHVGAGLRPTEKPLRQTADTAVQGGEA